MVLPNQRMKLLRPGGHVMHRYRRLIVTAVFTAAIECGAPGHRVDQIVAGGDASCAVTDEGRAYCWGGRWGPVPTAFMSSVPWRPMALSLRWGCGVTIQGTAFCWGSNKEGQLGIAPDTVASHEPKPLAGLPPLAEIGVSSDHVCALTSAGEMYCWGNNDNGQLGRGTFTAWEAPGRVIGAQRFSVFDLRRFATCAVTTDGIAYCWGDGSSMPLGYEPEQECPDGRAANEDGTVHISHCGPVPQAITADVRFTGIVVGPFVPCGLTKHGQMICWESQPEQHGNETVMGPPRFYREGDLPALISISAGGGHRCGLTSAHVVWCWGSNSFGQLARPEHLDAETYVPRPSAEGLHLSRSARELHTRAASPPTDTCTAGGTTGGGKSAQLPILGDRRWFQYTSRRTQLMPQEALDEAMNPTSLRRSLSAVRQAAT